MNLPANWQDVEKDRHIMVFEGCEKAIFRTEFIDDSGNEIVQHFCFVQHNPLLQSPTYGKIGVRDGRWKGALKAFIINDKDLKVKMELSKDSSERKPLDHLEFVRWSRSGKSIMVRAFFK